MVVLLLVLLLASSAVAAPATPEQPPCRRALPDGPSVPAPIVFRTSCGAFRLARSGELERLPTRWLARRSGGTGRRYGADLRIVRNRPGRIVLRRDGGVVWQSRDLYPNDAGSIAFGPRSFAFASYQRGVFLTDRRSAERLVMPGVGLYPLAFLHDDSLLVVEGGRGGSISVLARTGSVLRRYRYRVRNGFAFDQRTESLFFVTADRLLARAEGATVEIVRPLGGLGGWLAFAGPHLGFQSEDAFEVIRRDGTLVSRWSLPGWKEVIDYGISGARDGRTFAFRTATRRTGGSVTLYVLREGVRRAIPLLRHRGGQAGCGTGATLGWHGRFLLYASTDGPAAVVDARDGSARNLTELVSRLPRRALSDRAEMYWLSELAKPAR